MSPNAVGSAEVLSQLRPARPPGAGETCQGRSFDALSAAESYGREALG